MKKLKVNLFMWLLVLFSLLISALHYLEKAYLFFKSKRSKNDKKNNTKK
tara:strand:+ start:163 stop:309 length:147 start_codon:yes stop_codon:yes gene_type:complete